VAGAQRVVDMEIDRVVQLHHRVALRWELERLSKFNPVDQGRLAARALLGTPLRDQVAPLPSFWSHQYDWRLQAVGFTGSRFGFRMVDQDTSGRLVGEYRHLGRLVGAIANGRPRDLVRYRQQLHKGSMDRHTTKADAAAASEQQGVPNP
jgi:hypothetical protein